MAEQEPLQPGMEPLQLDGGASEGGEETRAETQTPEVDIEGLVATLDKIGVRTPEHLEGVFHTAQAHGTTANELGAARAEIAKLQGQMAQMQRDQQRQPLGDHDYEQQGQPVDIGTEFERAAERVIHRMIIEPQMQASNRYWQEMEMIETNEYYLHLLPISIRRRSEYLCQMLSISLQSVA